jgi:hypothetical protein
MSNSLVNCNISFFVQDQLVSSGSTAQSFINRTFPQMSFPSGIQAVYSGYQYLQSNASSVTITPNGVQIPVVIIRNAGLQNISVSMATVSGNPTLDISTNGVFLLFNPTVLNIGTVSNVTLSAQNIPEAYPVTFEYLWAY